MAEIERVELLQPRRVGLSPRYAAEPHETYIVKSAEQLLLEARKAEFSTGEKYILAYRIVTGIIPELVKICTGYIMGDWKTTVTATVTAAAAIVAHFGFDLGAEVQGVIISIGLAIVGFFAKDKPAQPKKLK